MKLNFQKNELLNPSDKNTILFNVFSGIHKVKPWNGEQLKDIDKKYWELKYSELEEELKDYKKHLKELKSKVQ